MQQATMTCGSCRASFSAPATLFQTGGTILCPFCRQPNIVGAQVHQQQQHYSYPPQQQVYVAPPAPPYVPAPAPDKTSNKVAVVVVVAIVALGIAATMPAFGLVVGLLVGALAVGYLAAPKFRVVIDGILPAVFNSNVRRLGLAAATLVWSFMLLFAAITGHQTEVEQEAATERKQEAVAAKAEADHATRDGLLASAKQKLAAGDLEGARADLTSASVYERVPEMATLSEELATALHERDLKRLPGLLADVQAHNTAQEWSAALGDCTRARAIDSQYAGLQAACDAATEGERLAAIPGWIDVALAVAGDETRCETPVDIADAWKNLRQIKPSDPGYKKAQGAATKLEKCRKKTERILSTGIRDFMIHQRVEWAKDFELNLLDQGMDVRVTLSGTHKRHAKIRWILLSRAGVHELVKDGTFLAPLEKIGFEKVTFSDGFYELWLYELNPQSEEGGGKLVLDDFGLDKPLSL